MKLFRALSAAVLSCMLCAATAHAADDVLRVATDATFPPLEFVKDGQRTGFDIDLINAIAKTLNKRVEWVDIDFKGLIPGLIAHRFDVAASGIYMTEERRQVVDFTDPYYKGGLAVLVRRDEPGLRTPADLAGRKVSVQVGTKSVDFLKQNYPTVQRVEVEKNQAMFDLLMIRRVDAAVTGRPAAVQFAKSQGSVRVLDKGLTTELYGFALRKDEKTLTTQFDTALQTLRTNGVYAKLVAKWFGPSE
ncbi:transporter substrate-binding domain-containing protein [Robbsia sp. Bb-Pol-6]|uniref:Transporter substrate-binding domain-containing protein n=1 Tax=Robbsia betulipollinis TaxID=2981849 RepID=A0ABT3ZS81_9BURK|nr:transporter substrate-binding domain-containing protein [Robbsia betulipollinis]MCY0389410.1 transporter substrate-binding domain-containing protein [Robbsia betulipollinis]